MLTTPLEKFSFDASLSLYLSPSNMQICDAREEWNRILIRRGGFHRNRNMIRRQRDEDVGKEDERDGGERRCGWKSPPPFLPLNSKVSTFQLGHVHCTRWARTCAQMPAGALGIQPFSPLPPDGNWKIRSENHGSQKFYDSNFSKTILDERWTEARFL